MLRPNISSEIQYFLKALILGCSKNVTQFLTVIKIKINNGKVSRNYPPYYPKKPMSPYQDLYFCAMDNITNAFTVTLEA